MISRGYGSGTITTNPLVCVLRLHIWRSVCVCVSTCLCHVVEATRLLANVRLCPLLCFKLSPLFFDLAKLSTCLFGSDLMLFKGCPDSRLAGSILFLLCLFRSIVSNSCLAGTKTKRIFIFWPDHSNALPPSFSAHKKKKEKEKKKKEKKRKELMQRKRPALVLCHC